MFWVGAGRGSDVLNSVKVETMGLVSGEGNIDVLDLVQGEILMSCRRKKMRQCNYKNRLRRRQ